MAIFSKKEDKDQKKSSATEAVAIAPAKAAAKSKDNTGAAYRILIRPVVSEKAFKVAKDGKYIFIVNKTANKIEIRKAVEKVYDVKVVRVNIINVSGKNRVFGRTSGRTSDWKKAVVTLKKGQIIGEAQV